MKTQNKSILLLILLLVITAFASYSHMPNQIPISTGSNGILTSYLPAFAIYLPPLVLLFAYSVFLLCQPHLQKNSCQIASFCVTILGLLCLICQLYFIGLSFGIHFEQASVFLPVSLGFLASALSSFVEISKKDSTWNALLSFPFRKSSVLWIVKNSKGWEQIRYFTGKAWFILGLLIIYSSLLFGMLKLFLVIMLLLLLVVLPLIYICLLNKH